MASPPVALESLYIIVLGSEVQKGNKPNPIRRVGELWSKTLREGERDVKTRPRIAIQGVWQWCSKPTAICIPRYSAIPRWHTRESIQRLIGAHV